MADPKPLPPRHERRDVPPLWVGGGLLLMLPLLAGIVLVPLWLFPQSRNDVALRGPLKPYPEPRLQTATGTAMERFRAQDRAALDGVRWADRDKGLVHVPVAEAMRRVAAQGIPDWPTTPDPPERGR